MPVVLVGAPLQLEPETHAEGLRVMIGLVADLPVENSGSHAKVAVVVSAMGDPTDVASCCFRQSSSLLSAWADWLGKTTDMLLDAAQAAKARRLKRTSFPCLMTTVQQ